MGTGHKCRESSNPRLKGRCDCGKNIDPLTLTPLDPVPAIVTATELEVDGGNAEIDERDKKFEEVKARIMANECESWICGNSPGDPGPCNPPTPNEMRKSMREFDTGATRDTDADKLDYEGFLSPAALRAFAEYMHKHRVQSDGSLRDSDNWQKGIPQDEYMKSMFRHFMEVWEIHRNHPEGDRVDALCALLFNVMGYLHEEVKLRD